MPLPQRLLELQMTRPVLSLTLMRILLGLIFMKEGTGKLFGWFNHGGIDITTAYFNEIGIPMPGFNAVFVGCVESVSGLCLAVGLFARLAVVPLVVVMMTAILTVHTEVGYFYPLILCSCFFVVAQSGAGGFSLDEYISSRNLSEPANTPYDRLKQRD